MSTVPFETTLHIRDHCLCLHTHRAARRLARRFDEALRPFGLTHGQFSLMNALNRPAPPLMGDVASLLAMDRTTLTAALKPLERAGLVWTARDERDRRGKRMGLTASGAAALARAVPVWREVHADIEKGMAPGAADALRAELGGVAAGPTPTAQSM